MRLFLIANALFAPIMALYGSVQEEDIPPQEHNNQEQKITDPRWVVIYDYEIRESRSTSLLNMRVVVHAKSEGDAIFKASMLLTNQFGKVIDMDKLKFIEAAPMRVDDKTKKEEKK